MTNSIREIRLHLKKLGIEAMVSDAIMDIIQVHARIAPDHEPPSDNPPTIEDIGAIAKQFHRTCLRRGDAMGQPVTDPGWNMLLALIADVSEGRPSSVTSLCYASGAPMTTAARHLHLLEAGGLVKRRDHKRDARRAIIEANPATIDKMSALIVSFCVKPPEPSA